MTAPASKVIYSRVPLPVHNSLVALAEAQRVPYSALVALALKEFIERVGPGDRVELQVSHVEG